jgi:adenine-specific DNA-methyltransferase
MERENGKRMIKTEGIRYCGSKAKLIPYILDLVSRTKSKTILDGFSGTTRVSQALAKSGYKVVCNDIAIWSKVFGQCYLLNKRKRSSYFELIKKLNKIEPIEGWFTKNYGGSPNEYLIDDYGNPIKKPWQRHNTMKLDGIQLEIEKLGLSEIEKAVALTSLILGLDKVSNTIGHYSSYVENWYPNSFNQLRLKTPMLFENKEDNEVLCENIFSILDRNVDLAYFDPPYGSNNLKMPSSRVRYASYYHVWKTIILNDKPKLVGRTFRREDCKDSNSISIFEEFRKNQKTNKLFSTEAIEHLISKTNANWIILSYSSNGKSTIDDIYDIMNKNGKLIKVFQLDHKRNVMAFMKWTGKWLKDSNISNCEFLFLLEK